MIFTVTIHTAVHDPISVTYDDYEMVHALILNISNIQDGEDQFLMLEENNKTTYIMRNVLRNAVIDVVYNGTGGAA